MTTTADPIPELRHRIDALDEQIIRLVADRAALSAQVQEHRLAAGGVRLALERERAILHSYRDGLGDSGSPVGEAILHLCRGRL